MVRRLLLYLVDFHWEDYFHRSKKHQILLILNSKINDKQ